MMAPMTRAFASNHPPPPLPSPHPHTSPSHPHTPAASLSAVDINKQLRDNYIKACKYVVFGFA
jgi:hypothetical protein